MSERAERKRTQTKGLKPTSVVRELKKGSHIQKVRVTASAAEAAVKAAEVALASLGRAATKRLDISKKKTVDVDLLAAVIREDQPCKGLSEAAARSGLGGDRSKKDRRSIATASAMRSFAKGCSQGQGKNRTTEQAKDAMSAITEAYLHKLGADASRYAEAAGRQTIKSSDIAAVLAQRD